jgi:hypothetical protein
MQTACDSVRLTSGRRQLFRYSARYTVINTLPIVIADIPLCSVIYRVNRLFLVAVKHNNMFSVQFSLFYWRHVSAFSDHHQTILQKPNLRYMQCNLCCMGSHNTYSNNNVYINITLSKTKLNLLYIRNQSVPRCKHFPPRL